MPIGIAASVRRRSGALHFATPPPSLDARDDVVQRRRSAGTTRAVATGSTRLYDCLLGGHRCGGRHPGWRVSTKRRVSSSATASSVRHCGGSSVAAASTGAETLSWSDAKYSSRPTGKGRPATAARSRCAEVLVDVRGLRANAVQRLRDDGAGSTRACSCDEVDQLPPADGGVVAVASRLVQYGQQAIVETHLQPNPSDAPVNRST